MSPIKFQIPAGTTRRFIVHVPQWRHIASVRLCAHSEFRSRGGHNIAGGIQHGLQLVRQRVDVWPFDTKLANNTHGIELAKPVVDGATTLYVNVGKCVYRDIAPWPTAADGGGKSLQRFARDVIDNTAANWPTRCSAFPR